MLCPGLLMSASALGLTPAPGDAAEISPTLQSLIAFCDDEYAIPVWMRRKQLAGIERRAAAADPMHVSKMPRSAWRPRALSHFLEKHDAISHAFPPHILFPIPFRDRRLFFLNASRIRKLVRDYTASIHLYKRRSRDRFEKRNGEMPPPNSHLACLAERHGIAI